MKGPQMKTIQATTALFLATTLTVSAAMSFNLNDISTEYNGALAEESSPRVQQQSAAPKKAVIKGPVKKLNEVQQVTAPDAELKATFDMMTQEIVRVQAIYDSGQYGQALSESKKLLDTVRMRTGIHPKAKITEKIEIKDVFNEGEHKIFNQLNDEQKEQIIRATLNHRGGLYLDILNQSKRASLIYLKSLYKRLKQDGPLLKEDITKFKEDILTITSIKIDFIQLEPEVKFSANEIDLVNSDQNYLFNREIKIFALGNKDLNWSESDFDADLNKRKVGYVEYVKPVEIEIYEIGKCTSLIDKEIGHYHNNIHSKDYITRLDKYRIKEICESASKAQIDCAVRVYDESKTRTSMNEAVYLCANIRIKNNY